MKIKREQALKMWKLFEKFSGQKLPVKFSYFISKNKNKIKEVKTKIR